MILSKTLPQLLLPWYDAEKRELPWRDDNHPYHIWVSEIMLQQTRVEAVKGYYAAFLQAFPTVEALANADDELLTKRWEGLGYYNRVRNMKKAARCVTERFGGAFPREYNDLRSLPGIGPYTAGAIASIAFNQPTPAVDGNVLRVVSRLCDDSRPVDTDVFRRETEAALKAIYPAQAGKFTQALMELGATLCGPNLKPQCQRCPCKELCLACQKGTAEALPNRMPKRERKEEQRTVFILSCGDRYAICKRENRGLLAGLWQYPNVSGYLSEQEAVLWAEREGLTVTNLLFTVQRKHIFTHITWQMRGIYMEVKDIAGNFTWLTQRQMEREAALPTAFRQFGKDLSNV